MSQTSHSPSASLSFAGRIDRLNAAIGRAAAWACLFVVVVQFAVGGHVRVDVFYADASPRTKALVDLCGSILLLLPFMAVLAWFAWPYVSRSWAIFETSRETSGIAAVFLLKTLIPVFALLMALQGVSQAIKGVAVLRGKGEP
jgi:TRAP-type mannitol/chloroaromatic compound transport system permease small subunit